MVDPMPAYSEPRPSVPSTGLAISWAWGAFKRNLAPFVGLAAVVALIQLVQTLASRPMTYALEDCTNPVTEGQIAACEAALGTTAVSSAGIMIVFTILAMFAQIGVMRAALRTTQGATPSFNDMLTTQNLGKYVLFLLAVFGIAIVGSILFFLGLLLLVVPGLIVLFLLAATAFLLQLGPWYVIDRGYGVGQAMRASFTVVKRNIGPAVLMVLFSLLVSIIGGTFWGIPTLVTLPFASLFIAHMYRQFNGEPITG